MQYILPITPQPNRQVRVELNENQYFLQYRYNARQDTWVINVLDGEQNPLRTGILVKSFGELFELPDGTLLCFVDQNLNLKDVQYEEFGSRVLIGYEDFLT